MSTQLTPAAVPTWAPPQRKLHVGRGEAFVFVVCAAAVGWAVYALRNTPPLLIDFRGDALGRVGDVLAPLVLISAFVERAVEVVISAWREPVARELQAEMDTLVSQYGDVNAPAVQNATRRARDYKSDTLQIAFMISFTLSLLVAMSGVRAIGQFLQDPDALVGVRRQVLNVVDVLVSALMLAGGAEGFHRIVTTFNSYMDATKEKLSGTNPTTSAQTTATAGPVTADDSHDDGV